MQIFAISQIKVATYNVEPENMRQQLLSDCDSSVLLLQTGDNITGFAGDSTV